MKKKIIILCSIIIGVVITAIVISCSKMDQSGSDQATCGTCNWYGTNFPVCCNTTSGWGWENNASCISKATCTGAGQTCTGCSSSSSSSSSGCAATTIVPYIQVNGGSWSQTASASVASGATVKFGPQPNSGGSWSWSGLGTSGTSREQTIYPTASGTATATYTNTCGTKSTQAFTINVSGSSSSSSSSSSGGGTCGTTDFSLGQYFYMMDAWGGGGYCIWYNNMNSWGANAPNVNASGIVGYPAMVRGCHWSGCSSNSGLPKQISALGSLSTNWTQSNSGNSYDAAYDIWFDASSNPGNRAATYELMVWLNWSNTQPIATNYDASGNAVPYASNVNLGGVTFNVYHRGNVMSFLRTSKSNSISFTLKPLADYCVSQGWISNSSVYLISIEAGWEIIKGGNYSTSSYGISGL